MKIGFIPYSIPLRWWNNTNIAHNRIFYYAVKAFAENTTHTLFTVNGRLDTTTAREAAVYGVKPLADKNVDQLDCLVMLCGPFIPIVPDSITHTTINLLSRFEGKVVYLTCDYLLQFDFRVSRYGKMFSSLPEDAFLRNKEWKYVLHGGFDHHFKTEARRQNALAALKRECFIEVPLNKSGISPKAMDYSSRPEWHYDLLYCGAFRADREEFFLKYFFNMPQGWFVSTPHAEKFKRLLKTRNIVGPYPNKIWDQLRRSAAQIVFSDNVDAGYPDTPLPTRFWEAASSPSCVFFDRTCESWLRSGFNSVPDDLLTLAVVDGPDDLHEKVKTLRGNSRAWRKHVDLQLSMTKGFDPFVDWRMAEWV